MTTNSSRVVAAVHDCAIARIKYDPAELQIRFADGTASRLDALWLRDHCQMPECRNPVNGQRLTNVTDLCADTRIESAGRNPQGDVEIRFAPDGHRSIFTALWLRRNAYDLNPALDDRSATAKTRWDAATFGAGTPRGKYSAYLADPTVRRTSLAQVRDFGFALLEGVPCEAGQVIKVARTFGFVRETNYGALFDVRSAINPNNLAYTNLGLGCHTDNPYRDPVPTIQLLHCLANSVDGGDSILVDGFMAAAQLRDESPTDFDTLVHHWVNFRFTDSCTTLVSRVPMIALDDRGAVVQIRYNSRSIATLIPPAGRVRAFYRAYRHFGEILERAALKIAFRLSPGDVLLMDNTRVLHARTAFSAGGQRHLQGAYADLDGLYSTLMGLERNAAPATPIAQRRVSQ